MLTYTLGGNVVGCGGGGAIVIVAIVVVVLVDVLAAVVFVAGGRVRRGPRATSPVPYPDSAVQSTGRALRAAGRGLFRPAR